MKSYTGLIGHVLLVTLCLSLDPEKLILIDDVVNNEFIGPNSISGMGLSVVHNGEMVVSKGYGHMNIEENIDAHNETVFLIASTSKSFTGTLVVKYLSETYPSYRESILDVPIVELAPDFNFTLSDRFRSEETTFRDLLSHRTCLSTQGLGLMFGSVSLDEYLYRTRYEKQVCGHRGGFVYGNSMYALASELIASLQGKSSLELYREFMYEIGMQDSSTIDTDASYENLPNMSKSYYRKDGEFHRFNSSLNRRISIALGAGGIISTPTDIAKYMNFHLNKGKVDERQVVSQEALSWMYKLSIGFETFPGQKFDGNFGDSVSATYGYGLGFFLSLHKGFTNINHSGYWMPFQSELAFYPAKNTGIFVVSNGPGLLLSGFNHAALVAAIFDIIHDLNRTSTSNLQSRPSSQFPYLLHELGITKLTSSERPKTAGRVEKLMSCFQFQDVLGLYGNEEGGDLTLTLDTEDSAYLQVNWGEWGIGRLLSTNETALFSVQWKTDILHDFYASPIHDPSPTFQFELGIDTVSLLGNGVLMAVFVLDATLDTFPVIPWEPNSCGPSRI